jgi:hypothetical protein
MSVISKAFRPDSILAMDRIWRRSLKGSPRCIPEIAEGRAHAVDPDLPALMHLHAFEYIGRAILETKAVTSTFTYTARCT